MQKSSTLIERVEKIDRDLQSLKVDLYLELPQTRRPRGPYRERDIVRAVRRIRKKLWNEKYARNR